VIFNLYIIYTTPILKILLFEESFLVKEIERLPRRYASRNDNHPHLNPPPPQGGGNKGAGMI